MAESLGSIVQELKVLLNEVAEKMGKLSKISHEVYCFTMMIDEICAKVIEAREVARKIERMVKEGRYGGRQG